MLIITYAFRFLPTVLNITLHYTYNTRVANILISILFKFLLQTILTLFTTLYTLSDFIYYK